MKRIFLVLVLAGCESGQVATGPTAFDLLKQACIEGDTTACAQAAQIEADQDARRRQALFAMGAQMRQSQQTDPAPFLRSQSTTTCRPVGGGAVTCRSF